MEFLRSAPMPTSPILEQFVIHLRLSAEQISAVEASLAGSASSAVPVGAHRALAAAGRPLCAAQVPMAAEVCAGMAESYTAIGSSGDEANAPGSKNTGDLHLTAKHMHAPVYPSTAGGVACMWDCAPFDTQPVGVPISYDGVTGEFRTVGCFCSVSCAAAYNMADHRISDTTRYERHALLGLLADRHLAEDSGGRWSVAPERECLRKFGGRLTVDEFRRTCARVEHIKRPPFRPYAVYQLRTPDIVVPDISAAAPARRAGQWRGEKGDERAGPQGAAVSKETASIVESLIGDTGGHKKADRGLGRFISVKYEAK